MHPSFICQAVPLQAHDEADMAGSGARVWLEKGAENHLAKIDCVEAPIARLCKRALCQC